MAERTQGVHGGKRRDRSRVKLCMQRNDPAVTYGGQELFP